MKLFIRLFLTFALGGIWVGIILTIPAAFSVPILQGKIIVLVAALVGLVLSLADFMMIHKYRK